MATVTVHLVRHATHDGPGHVLAGRGPGIGLSEAGRREVAALSRRFDPGDIAWIETSPRERAVRTAEGLARTLGHPARVEASLDEVDFGAWTGRAFADLADDPEWRRWNAARALALPPGGESIADVLARMNARLARLRREAPGAAVVLVSHAEPIRTVLLAALGLGADAWDRLRIDPAGISTLELHDDGTRVRCINERARP